jgi:hypothetical protein
MRGLRYSALSFGWLALLFRTNSSAGCKAERLFAKSSFKTYKLVTGMRLQPDDNLDQRYLRLLVTWLAGACLLLSSHPLIEKGYGHDAPEKGRPLRRGRVVSK